jgi:hypothetical protein
MAIFCSKIIAMANLCQEAVYRGITRALENIFSDGFSGVGEVYGIQDVFFQDVAYPTRAIASNGFVKGFYFT